MSRRDITDLARLRESSIDAHACILYKERNNALFIYRDARFIIRIRSLRAVFVFPRRGESGSLGIYNRQIMKKRRVKVGTRAPSVLLEEKKKMR